MTRLTLFSIFLLSSFITAEEVIFPENPSALSGGNNNLSNQVGKAIITEQEQEKQRLEEERIAAKEAKEAALEAARMARIQARKSGEAILPSEYIGYSGQPSFTIGSGDTLGKIAKQNYGNNAYSTFLSIFNEKKANKLFIGDEVKTPTPTEVFTQHDRSLYEKYPYAVRDVLKIHEQLKKLAPTLIKQQNEDGKYSDEIKAELDEMIWVLNQAKLDFLEEKEGIDNFPTSTTTQLHSALTNLKAVRKGRLGRKNLRIQRVYLYLVNGYSYAYQWAKDGFN